VWGRPHFWIPYRKEEGLALQVHFDLKEVFDYPEAIFSNDELVFYKPVRPGDRVTSWQVLRSVSDIKTTRVGTGRLWTIEGVYANQNGESVATDTLTGFAYRGRE
jgi:acyl dehydratase